MQMSELLTVSSEKVPICVVVMNDGHYTMVERGNMAVFGRTPTYPTGPMDVPALARALDFQTVRVSEPNQLREALISPPTGAPVVIESAIDRSIRMPKHARGEQFAKEKSDQPPNLRLVKVA